MITSFLFPWSLWVLLSVLVWKTSCWDQSFDHKKCNKCLRLRSESLQGTVGGGNLEGASWVPPMRRPRQGQQGENLKTQYVSQGGGWGVTAGGQQGPVSHSLAIRSSQLNRESWGGKCWGRTGRSHRKSPPEAKQGGCLGKFSLENGKDRETETEMPCSCPLINSLCLRQP